MIRRPDELSPITLCKLNPRLKPRFGLQEVPHAHQEPGLDCLTVSAALAVARGTAEVNAGNVGPGDLTDTVAPVHQALRLVTKLKLGRCWLVHHPPEKLVTLQPRHDARLGETGGSRGLMDSHLVRPRSSIMRACERNGVECPPYLTRARAAPTRRQQWVNR